MTGLAGTEALGRVTREPKLDECAESSGLLSNPLRTSKGPRSRFGDLRLQRMLSISADRQNNGPSRHSGR